MFVWHLGLLDNVTLKALKLNTCKTCYMTFGRASRLPDLNIRIEVKSSNGFVHTHTWDSFWMRIWHSFLTSTTLRRQLVHSSRSCGYALRQLSDYLEAHRPPSYTDSILYQFTNSPLCKEQMLNSFKLNRDISSRSSRRRSRVNITNDHLSLMNFINGYTRLSSCIRQKLTHFYGK